jgi:hypothetical protein
MSAPAICPPGFAWSQSSSLSFAVSAVATSEEQDAGRKIEAPQHRGPPPLLRGSLRVSQVGLYSDIFR